MTPTLTNMARAAYETRRGPDWVTWANLPEPAMEREIEAMRAAVEVARKPDEEVVAAGDAVPLFHKGTATTFTAMIDAIRGEGHQPPRLSPWERVAAKFEQMGARLGPQGQVHFVLASAFRELDSILKQEG